MNQQHIIKRQIIEISTSSKQLAQRAQIEISQLSAKQIVKLIDQHCSRLSDKNTLHRIDSIELDLGDINIENLNTAFCKQLDKQLKKQLPNYINLSQNHQYDDQQVANTALKRSSQYHRVNSQLELISHFARTGYLPWWADTQNTKILEQCLDYLLINNRPVLQQQLQKFIRQQQPLLRLINHFDEARLKQLLSLFPTDQLNSCLNIIDKLCLLIPQSKLGKPLSDKLIKQTLWSAVFQSAISDKNQAPAEYIYTLLHLFTQQRSLSFGDLQSELQTLDESFFASVSPHQQSIQKYTKLLLKLQQNPRNIQHLADIQQLINQSKTPVFFIEQVLLILHSIQLKTTDSAQFIQLLNNIIAPFPLREIEHKTTINPTLAKQPENEKSNFTSSDEIYLNNAGLIILWPFLERFFATMQWLKNKQFKDQQSQHKALTALHYLATGEAHAEEFMLVLNKLLCGMPIDSLYQIDQPLSQAELSACDELIEAVIANAPILKNTSINGFRASFLNRAGILSHRDGLWLLRVERETHDLLLDRLPWAFEWFKLPWMPLAMRVEW